MTAYTYATIAFFIEITILVVIVFATFLLKIFHTYLFRLYRNNFAKLHHRLKEGIDNKSVDIIKKIPEKWCKLHMMIPIIKEFDEKFPEKQWQLIRKQLIEKIVLPLSNANINKDDLRVRFLAIQGLELASELVDKEIIKGLLGDEIPLIKIFAMDIAIKIGLKELAEFRIKNEKRVTLQAVYKQLL